MHEKAKRSEKEIPTGHGLLALPSGGGMGLIPRLISCLNKKGEAASLDEVCCPQLKYIDTN